MLLPFESMIQAQLDIIVRWQQAVESHNWAHTISGSYSLLPYICVSVYLVVSRRIGSMLLLLFTFDEMVVEVIKLMFHMPRPYWVDERVHALSTSTSYAMPSGHVQAAAVVAIYLAFHTARLWFRALLGVFITAMAASRVFLGVHFFHDALAGIAVAFILALLFYRSAERVGRFQKT